MVREAAVKLPKPPGGRAVWAWACYDWANSAFATTVMAGFFPIFFKEYWSAGTDPTVSTFQLGMANGLASIVIAALAPILGSIADRGSAKKRFLLLFATLGIVMSGGLYFVAQGDWPLAALLYIIAIVGFEGGNVFYDSLIVGLTARERLDRVSALGYSLGYLGGGLLFTLNVLMTLNPESFGLAGKAEAVRWSFVMVAAWWALFSIPLFVFVPEPRIPGARRGWRAVTEGLRQLARTMAEIRRLRMVFVFLLAYWLYIDGVHTTITMAVDYGLSLGFKADSLIVALLVVQFVGFPAALGFGWLGQRLGPQTGLYIALSVYSGVTVWAYFLSSVTEFYILAVLIGLVQGGVQALSRSLYARMVPADKAGEFFGFYGLLGKFAAIIGPFLVAWTGLLSGSSRLGILSLLVLFVAGGLLLSRVDVRRGEREAGALTGPL